MATPFFGVVGMTMLDDQVGKHLEDNCRVYCAVVAGTRHNLNLGDSLGVQLLLGAYLENDKKYVYLPIKNTKKSSHYNI